jgi:hypothetical protein
MYQFEFEFATDMKTKTANSYTRFMAARSVADKRKPCSAAIRDGR